jgi:glycosyltransferase involved in cell wall biosynthesis
MIRVLILAYDFPPYVSVGGLRPHSWFKYFKEFDIEPIVITRQWGNTYGNHLDFIAQGWSKECVIEESLQGITIRTPYSPNLSNRLLLRFGEKRYKWLRKVISAYYEVLQFFFVVGPKKEIYNAAKFYLAQHKVDVIIATGEPFVLFHYARKLGAYYKIPWIADYRDPWSNNNTRQQSKVLYLINKMFEKNIVATAKSIQTVSDYTANQIKEITNLKDIVIFPNGYDDELFKGHESESHESNILRIAFGGRIYPWHPINEFLEGLCEAIKLNVNIRLEINFFGVNLSDEQKHSFKTKFSLLSDKLHFHDAVPNHEYQFALRNHHVLLLFNDYTILGTKIFDYLAAKRRIWFCFSQGHEGYEKNVQAEIIHETNSGIFITNKMQLIREIENVWDEFINHGEIRCESINTQQFSRRIQAERLANLIKTLAKPIPNDKLEIDTD